MPLKDRQNEKSSGVLLAISSLPGRFGVGTFGKAAYDFVDFLRKSRQSYWQILPLNPIGEGNSPYKSISCFGGEILYIDIDFLVRDGLLSPEDLPREHTFTATDYDAARKYKMPLLKKAANNFNCEDKDYKSFLADNLWLENHAIFCAACEYYNCILATLPDGIKYQLPKEIERFKGQYEDEIRFHKIMQYIFYCQYFDLKRYANKNGVKIIGDIPFYVSDNSADVWGAPQNFRLNRDFTPHAVAGVPPDSFSKHGQLWGNPIYDWQYQRRDGYSWWINRLVFSARLYDALRIDHFRAFASFYSIPFGAESAKCGKWETGVGMDFWDKALPRLEGMEIIAEDLGGEDDARVSYLLKQTGFANMEIMQFGFLKDSENPFTSKNYKHNCVCYTATHDNDTSLGWYNTLNHKQRIIFDRLFGEDGLPVPHAMIKSAALSNAKLIIVPMQDLLCLDSSARMNTPGTKNGNWVWRMDESALTEENANLLLKLTARNN